MSWFVYILRCADETLYTGSTNSVERRFREHSNGRGSKYVRARRPLKIVYIERKRTRTAARRRELEIKRLPRAGKLALLQSF